MQTVDHLLLLVRPFCHARGISEARLSTLLFNDGKRIGAMRKRRGDIGSRKLVEAFAWFSEHWPDGVAWPADITRPSLPALPTAPLAAREPQPAGSP